MCDECIEHPHCTALKNRNLLPKSFPTFLLGKMPGLFHSYLSEDSTDKKIIGWKTQRRKASLVV